MTPNEFRAIPAKLLFFLFATAGLVFAAEEETSERQAHGDSSAVVRHSAAVSEANALIAEVRVSLSRPARVFVEYDNPLAGRYRTRLEAPAAEHTIPIVRLRAETTYDYTVFTVYGSDGSDAVRGPSGSFTTGAPPEQLASMFTTATGRSSQPLILANGRDRGSGVDNIVLFDEVGALVWHANVTKAGPVSRPRGQDDFVFLPAGRHLKYVTPIGEAGDLGDLDTVGNAHHDFVVLGGGRVLFPIGRTLFHHYDSAGGGLRTVFQYDTLGIWHSATGKVEQVWNSKDVWNVTDPTQHWGRVRENGATRWTHMNSVTIGPRGNIVLSLRRRNQVVSLSPDYEIEWQLFGPHSDYEFPDPADRFYRQHTASQLANGNVLLFDNGNERPQAEGGEYSRALELRLDDAAGTATKVWEYRPDPDIYAPIVSSAYRLDNGNTLVNFGTRDRDDPPHPKPLVFVEADADGNEVFRVETVQLDWFSIRYRAQGIDAIRGETMLRPPTALGRSSEKHLTMRYEDKAHVAAGPFDLYLGGGRLMYAKDPCEAEDIALPFFLHAFPEERKNLPAEQREYGFENLDFKFMDHGMLWQDRCHAELLLPEYAIDHLRTGQFAVGDETAHGRGHPNGSPTRIWSVAIPLTP